MPGLLLPVLVKLLLDVLYLLGELGGLVEGGYRAQIYLFLPGF